MFRYQLIITTFWWCAIQSTYELLYVHLNLYSYCTTVRTSDVSCKLSTIAYLTSQLDHDDKLQ